MHTGISSLQYLCARLRIPWEDIYVVSAHGRPVTSPRRPPRPSAHFFLTGGETDAQSLCRALADCGMGDARVTIGSGLSYPMRRFL
jgi:precorrin-6Y C5,15-methyltransferase (decarboxylating)